MGEKRKKWMSKKDFEEMAKNILKEMAKRDRSNNVMARQAGQSQLALGRRRRKSSWVWLVAGSQSSTLPSIQFRVSDQLILQRYTALLVPSLCEAPSAALTGQKGAMQMKSDWLTGVTLID